MTSLLAKLPPKLQVELESIRRRLAAPFARFSVQKIFNEHADSIAKILALRFTHEELASILLAQFALPMHTA